MDTSPRHATSSRPTTRSTTLAVLLFVLLTAFAAPQLHAQLPMRPQADWRTVETRHFVVHYPIELEEWTLPVVEQLESIHASVAAAVGSVPGNKVTVLVDDPLNISNASASPGPTIVLWPTPADPRSMIGDHRGWGELVAVHEFVHVAHLARPTRNPGVRLLMRLLPFHIEPLWIASPRWLSEGYATYLEGRLTGSGRPHGTWRPALLRQWALEGRLPSYAQLSEVGGLHGGAMAYLAGSAFLEWLVERSGEESLPNLWSRMTARERRSFDENFAGVFGAPPSELYGRFAAELTGSALAVESTLEAAGIAAGEQILRRDWYTGDPALSPDGSLVAVTVHEPAAPTRVVVYRAEADTVTDRQRTARERSAARDPEDVPAVEWRPPPREAVATLWGAALRGHSSPRFMPDGVNILVTRPEGLGDGRVRNDLFMWNHETGSVRRITHGAAIRHPDPAPDGQSAVAVRCLAGSCDVVSIDLASGSIRELVRGTATRVFYRPRFSPDGSRIVLAVNQGERWRIATISAAGGTLQFVDPDDGASRFDAAYTPDGRNIVVVSDLAGIHNIELLDPGSRAVRQVTRVTGAALAPEPAADGAIWFLNLRSRAYDLHRMQPDSAAPVATVSPATTPLATSGTTLQRGFVLPVARAVRDTFPRAEIPPSRAYGLGPRRWSFFPLGVAGTEPPAFGMGFVGSDPVGRLTVIAQLLLGEPGAFRTGGLSAAWRRMPVSLEAEVFALEASLSDRWPELVGADIDVDQRGFTLASSVSRDYLGRAWSAYVGGTASNQGADIADSDRVQRTAFFGEFTASHMAARGRGYLVPEVHGHLSTGSTDGVKWQRVIGTAALTSGSDGSGLRGSVQWGSVGADAPASERFSVGGTALPIVHGAAFSHRIALPAIPPGSLGGEDILVMRAELTDGSSSFPYYVVAKAGGERRRIVGMESYGVTPPLTHLRVPSMRITMGTGYPLDGPTRKRFQFYGGLTLIP